MTKAMILAAGVGSRLDPITQHLPKPLVPVLNTPVIEHILCGLKQHGISEVIANTHYLAENLHSYFHENPVQGVNIHFLFESVLSGDAGGVRACKNFLSDDTFVVIMGDLITNADISGLVRAHKNKGAIATIGVKRVADVTRFGVVKRNEQGFIKEFQEKPQAHEAISNDISTGIYVLEPEVFKHIPESGVYGFGKQLFPSLVQKGLPVLGEDIHGFWSDIGTLDDLFAANMSALAGRIMPWKAYECNSRKHPGTKFVERFLLGSNCEMSEGGLIGPNAIVGNDCKIGKNVKMDNALIFPQSTIPSGLKIRNCIYAFNEVVPVSFRSL
jgi:mannose-1-phosphate guanylyltransferase